MGTEKRAVSPRHAISSLNKTRPGREASVPQGGRNKTPAKFVFVADAKSRPVKKLPRQGAEAAQ